MPRAIWSGSISFGLVEIPVSLLAAENPENELHFNLLDRRTMKPVGNSRINKETGEDVPWGEIVRGYEYEKGEYVLMTDEELRGANAKKSETVDIVGFVDLASIDPVYFDKPYYLKPVKKGSKGYRLLHRTLERTGKAGIAKVVLRTRQYLAALMPRGPALALVLLRYGDEVRSPESLEISAAGEKDAVVSEKELQLAEQLVEGMTTQWDPAEFHDDYREDVLDLIERKIKAGKTQEVLVEDRPKKRGGDVLDLMPLLKQSLEVRPKNVKPAEPKKSAEPNKTAEPKKPAEPKKSAEPNKSAEPKRSAEPKKARRGA